MDSTLPPKRQYNSSRRKAQARETRRQIIEAARRLFIERGYTGATIEAIAREAEVASETVFAAFGNKRTILAQLVKLSVGGDDQPIPLLQRPGPQMVLSEPDPVRRLHLFAQDITQILERVAPVFAILRLAAKSEPDIADLLKNILSERLQTMITMVTILNERNPLRAELSLAQAGETVWILTSPEVFTLLTVDRGWTSAQYSQWLGDALIRLLLP